MRAEGKNYSEIAAALGRSFRAVKSRVSDTNTRIRAEKLRAAWEAENQKDNLIIDLNKAEIIEFYELGWRFVGFNGGLCTFEWASEREPRWPQEMRRAA
jgi:hypothetical protein